MEEMEELLERVPQLLQADAFAQRIRQGLAKPEEFTRRRGEKKGELAKWESRGDYLYRENKLYVPDSLELRLAILAKLHDDPFAGHFASRRTNELVSRRFYWPRMAVFIEEYCGACGECQGGRRVRGKQHGLLEPLPVPGKVWEQVTMDFVTDLPASLLMIGGSRVSFDCVLVVVDRFTKMAHFIPTKKTIRGEELARVLTREIFRLHGVPAKVITDRGSVFAQGFWSDFMYCLRIKQGLSTAYHPQTDGQTERLNSVLEQYLRAYINFDQDD